MKHSRLILEKARKALSEEVANIQDEIEFGHGDPGSLQAVKERIDVIRDIDMALIKM